MRGAFHAARARGLREDPFLYGAVFTANSASLLLPGANLTNLIVLAHEPNVTGSTFAGRLAPAWAVSVALTIAFAALLRGEAHPEPYEPPRFEPRLGTAAVAAAAVLVLVLANPALPVLALGVAVAFVARTSPRVLNPPVLAGVFVVAVLLGTLARAVDLGALTVGRWRLRGSRPGRRSSSTTSPPPSSSPPSRRRIRARCCSASISDRTSPSPARCRRSSGSRSRARRVHTRRSAATRCSAPSSRR